MPIYKQTKNKLDQIKQKSISLEKDIQDLIELNLTNLLGLEFVSSEFAHNNLRIDTLAFNKETSSFVIIEYKRDKSFSVIDQGYAYLSLLLHNEAEFVLEYNDKTKNNLGKKDIDWSQSQVIFIAPSFTKYQKEALGFRDLPIQLWEVKKYDEDLLSFNQIESLNKSVSVKAIEKDSEIKKITKQIKQYSVEDHIKTNWKTTRILFDNLSQQILDLDERFSVHPVKHYIGFTIENKNVFAVKTQASKILLELLRVKPKDLSDPENKTRYKKHSFKYYNKHITQMDVKTEEDISYAMFLIKQVYKKFFS